jgi:hypothetical protein
MHSNIDSDSQREIDKIKKTIRVSPTWRGTAQALLLIIDRSENSEDVLWAKKEFVKMGGIVDELIADRKKTKELLESI